MRSRVPGRSCGLGWVMALGGCLHWAVQWSGEAMLASLDGQVVAAVSALVALVVLGALGCLPPWGAPRPFGTAHAEATRRCPFPPSETLVRGAILAPSETSLELPIPRRRQQRHPRRNECPTPNRQHESSSIE